jgi:ankyrin repeat protein
MKSIYLIAIAILAFGCGEKNEPTTKTKPLEEKQQEVKEEVQPEENSAETQPAITETDQSLYDATLLGETEKVKKAIADGADVNTKGALHNAVVASLDSGDNEIVEMFISNGANVNAKDDEGLTALDIIKSLSDIAAVSKNLRAAIGKTDDDIPVADLLRKHGAKTSEELKANKE